MISDRDTGTDHHHLGGVCDCRGHSLLLGFAVYLQFALHLGLYFLLPALMRSLLVREGKWDTPKDLILGVLSLCYLIISLVTLETVIYTSADDIIRLFCV